MDHLDAERGVSRPQEAAKSDGLHSNEWKPRRKGPVETLCAEIGFPFDQRLERSDVFVAFVGELVAEVAHMREVAVWLAPHVGKAPSEGSATVLVLADAMLLADTPDSRLAAAEAIHAASDELNPDEKIPTDHLIDMLASCASAIRFGLAGTYDSRHAAHAANHVWKQKYGVHLYDRHTPAWGKDWACHKLHGAIASLLPAENQPLSPSEASTGKETRDEP